MIFSASLYYGDPGIERTDLTGIFSYELLLSHEVWEFTHQLILLILRIFHQSYHVQMGRLTIGVFLDTFLS